MLLGQWRTSSVHQRYYFHIQERKAIDSNRSLLLAQYLLNQVPQENILFQYGKCQLTMLSFQAMGRKRSSVGRIVALSTPETASPSKFSKKLTKMDQMGSKVVNTPGKSSSLEWEPRYWVPSTALTSIREVNLALLCRDILNITVVKVRRTHERASTPSTKK